MTTDEQRDLHEQAAQLAYLAIRYANLSPLLSCEEWDGLADRWATEVVALLTYKIDNERLRIESEYETAKEAASNEH